MTAEQTYFLNELIGRVPPLRPNQCFDNCKSVLIADDTGRIEYVEGLIHHPAGDSIYPPHSHAWLLLDGVLVDPTPHHYSGLIGYEQRTVTRKKLPLR